MKLCRVLILGRQPELLDAGRSALRAFEGGTGAYTFETEYQEVATEAHTKPVLESASVDLVFVTCGNHSEGIAADSLQRQYSGIPFILLTTPSVKESLLKQSGLSVWDLVSTEECDRLPLVIRNAVDCHGMRKQQVHASGELEQAKNLLLKNQKSITVGRLLGSIAHEINNPLEAVTNLLFLAKFNIAGGTDPTVSLEMAEKEVQRVGNITRQMLSFHRESRVREEIAISGAMETALSLYEVRLRHANIQVERQYRNVGCVIAYPGEMRQVFSNLIANSVDAMASGGKLIVRIRERRGSSPGLCITIADTGAGMSREVSQHVGDLFFTTKGETGTGLGMWVTRQLIAKNGGSMRVYSSAREGVCGTVFRLIFPEPHARLEPLPSPALQEHPEATVWSQPVAPSQGEVPALQNWDEDSGNAPVSALA